MVKNHATHRYKSSEHRLPDQSFFNRLGRDTQRQVSTTTKRLEVKMSNSGWTRHMLRQYFTLKEVSIDQNMRYGIPKQSMNAHYITKCHDQIKRYIDDYPSSKLGVIGRRIYNDMSNTTLKLSTKAQRYNLRVELPKVLTQANPEYNGERIHIDLKEVL